MNDHLVPALKNPFPVIGFFGSGHFLLWGLLRLGLSGCLQVPALCGLCRYLSWLTMLPVFVVHSSAELVYPFDHRG